MCYNTAVYCACGHELEGGRVSLICDNVESCFGNEMLSCYLNDCQCVAPWPETMSGLKPNNNVEDSMDTGFDGPPSHWMRPGELSNHSQSVTLLSCGHTVQAERTSPNAAGAPLSVRVDRTLISRLDCQQMIGVRCQPMDFESSMDQNTGNFAGQDVQSSADRSIGSLTSWDREMLSSLDRNFGILTIQSPVGTRQDVDSLMNQNSGSSANQTNDHVSDAQPVPLSDQEFKHLTDQIVEYLVDQHLELLSS